MAQRFFERSSLAQQLLKAPSMEQAPCAACGSGELRRSNRRGIDHLVSWANLYPYRCLDCDSRCFRFGSRARRPKAAVALVFRPAKQHASPWQTTALHLDARREIDRHDYGSARRCAAVDSVTPAPDDYRRHAHRSLESVGALRRKRGTGNRGSSRW